MDLFIPQIDTEDFDGGQVGRLGEILTTFNLELHGIRTEIVRGQGSDLWCELPCGDMLRCEDKTARAMNSTQPRAVTRAHCTP